MKKHTCLAVTAFQHGTPPLVRPTGNKCTTRAVHNTYSGLTFRCQCGLVAMLAAGAPPLIEVGQCAREDRLAQCAIDTVVCFTQPHAELCSRACLWWVLRHALTKIGGAVAARIQYAQCMDKAYGRFGLVCRRLIGKVGSERVQQRPAVSAEFVAIWWARPGSRGGGKHGCNRCRLASLLKHLAHRVCL